MNGKCKFQGQLIARKEALLHCFVIKVIICGWIEHLISRSIASKRNFVALLLISIFDLRFLQEKYARRVSMKYFKNIPGRVWSVCEANSLNIEMS